MKTLAKLLCLLICLLMCQLLVPLASVAEECYTIDVDALDMTRLQDNDYVYQHLAAQTQGIRLRKYISDSTELAAPVRLSIVQAETDTVIYDRNYGDVSGTFDSGTIYLPYVDHNVIPYLITLNIGDWTYAMPFMHLQPRLTDNGACTWGVQLGDLDASMANSWLMGTMLDLDLLRTQGAAMYPIVASNLYIIGQATVSITADQLTVNLAFSENAQVKVSACAVYLAGDVSRLGGQRPDEVCTAYAPGQAIAVAGLSSALLYVPMTLSYDASSLNEFTYHVDDVALSAQIALWNTNLSQGETGEEDTAVPLEETPEPALTPEPTEMAPSADQPEPTEAPAATETEIQDQNAPGAEDATNGSVDTTPEQSDIGAAAKPPLQANA